jgi:hypothetical protein
MRVDLLLSQLLIASSISAAFFAAVFWFVASAQTIPDDMDTFIEALRRVSRINALGAFSAAISALSSVAAFLLQLTV